MNTYFVRNWILILFLFFIPFTSKSQHVKFVNCDYNKPIPDLFVFSEDGKYIGYSDSMGVCSIETPISRIKIIGLNIRDTIISTQGINTLCLELTHHNLQEFNIVEEHVDIKKTYIKMLEDSWDIMMKKDTTFYYNFSYTIDIPDSNWSETISGVLKVHAVISKKGKFFPLFPRVFYSKINYSVDDKFINSPIYQYSPTTLYEFMNIPLDLMYFKRDDIKKDIDNRFENIVLNTDENNMVFSMDKSNKKIKIRQKTYFKDDFIVRNELYSTEEKESDGLNSYYRNSEYTKSLTGKLLKELQLKKIVQKRGTFFVINFKVSLKDEEYKGESLDVPINILTNYQKWLKTQKK